MENSNLFHKLKNRAFIAVNCNGWYTVAPAGSRLGNTLRGVGLEGGQGAPHSGRRIIFENLQKVGKKISTVYYFSMFFKNY